MFSLLYQNQVELLLTGHEHNYQRFALNWSGSVDQQGGVVQLVVGTGGASRDGFTNSSPAPVQRNNTSYGVVALTLTATGWSSEFIPEAGATYRDSASGTCRGSGEGSSEPSSGTTAPTTASPVPSTDTQEPDSTVAAPNQGGTVGSPVAISGAATDDVGVSRVRVSVRNQASGQWLQDNGTFGSTFRQFDAARLARRPIDHVDLVAPAAQWQLTAWG